jgi:multiple sugar transport system permease protein
MTTAAREQAVAAPVAAEIAATRRRARARRRMINRGLTYAAAVLLALWVLAPIYLITITAFSPRQVVYGYPKDLIPNVFSSETMDFFVNAEGVLSALGRSVLVAVVTLVISTIIGAPAGYAISRFAFPGRDAYRLAILSTRAFPIVILSIPIAVTFIEWGIYDSIWAVALMHTALALPFTVLITASIFVSVPRDLEEAALTLGCTPATAFLKVVLPLALPGLAAASIFTFVLSWNEVFAAVILTLRERTLPALILSQLNDSPVPYRMAAAWFLMAPSLVFIFVIRRYLLGLWGRVSR